MNIYRNPFIVGLWAPAYLLAGAVTVTTDFLLATIYILATLAIIGAYVTDFPMLPGLYMNEVAHKTAIATLMGMLCGLVLFLISTGVTEEADTSPISPAGKFLLTWTVMSGPAYMLMVFLISKVNKRDLEAEQAIRDEKKKKRGNSSHPPLMNRDGF
ncbi:MAG: hypothetical protein HY580_00430 [Nitrospinae bacterium]|nr:hypothetical protein [Nitrospinota bacterium]